MDYSDLMLFPLLAFAVFLLAAALSGLGLFFSWLQEVKDAVPRSLWCRVWGAGWMVLVTALTLAWLNPDATWVGMTSGLMILFSALLWMTALLMFWQAKTLLFVGCLALPIVCLVSFTFLQHKSVTPPSDNELLVNFQGHQSSFNRLIQMVQADKNLTCVDGDCTRSDKTRTARASAGRAADYQRLLDQVQVGWGTQFSSTPGDTEFLYWGRGSAVSPDTDKGYTYLATPPAQVRATLDGCEPDVKNGSHYYRHIQGHWYLYYDYSPG